MEMSNFTQTDKIDSVAFMEECKPFSLSLPRIRVVDSTKLTDSIMLTDSISQTESFRGAVECLSSASSGEHVKTEPVKVEPVKLESVKVEPVIYSTDYAWVEPTASMNRSTETGAWTECKTAVGMTKEEKFRLPTIKEEKLEEGGLRLKVKMERDDGVQYGEGLGREQEKARDEQQRNGVTKHTSKTHRCQRSGGNSESAQRDRAAAACQRKEPRVLIHRLEITDSSVSVSSLPPELMTKKRKTTDQLERPRKQLPASSENGICDEASDNPQVISLRNKKTGKAVKSSFRAFGCSRCPFVHTEQETIHLHISKVHPELLIGTQVSEGSGGEKKTSKSGTHQNSKPPETLPTPKTQSRTRHTGTKQAHKCYQCGKNFSKLASLHMHRRTHKGKRPYHCSQCGKNFIHSVHLRVHQRTHNGERPYHCSQCGKNFMLFISLKKHLQSHKD